ncbi:MAG TPA: hypothetical protein VMW08_00090 [Acidimicrobiales bacterium]|nr:hypothetical protein [Acidimicrobiales bacterium]
MIYLTTGNTQALKAGIEAHPDLLGLLVTPRTYRRAGHPVDRWTWAADNDCFNAGDEFNRDAWLSWLDRMTPAARDRCLFAVAPDVVGDWSATLERSLPELGEVRSLGYRAALVLQDGLTGPDEVPWSEVDALFVGGTDDFKLSAEAAAVVAVGAARGLWVHMGRVNSRRRTLAAARMGCVSVDGTHLVFEGPSAVPTVLGWAREATNQGRLF